VGYSGSGPASQSHSPLIAVTHPKRDQDSLVAALEALGAEIVRIPTVSIEPAEDYAPLDRALEDLESFDWIVFTSGNAVEAVATRPAWGAAHTKTLPRLRVAAVGAATAARLAGLGVTAEVVPSKAGGAALAAALAEPAAGGPAPADARRPLEGVRILWPRSDIARDEMRDALVAAGAGLVDPVAYRTVPAGADPAGPDIHGLRPRLEAGEIAAVTFMSPSAARNLAPALGVPDLALLAGRTVIASIGPTTSTALRELGAPPIVESSARTGEDLAATLISYLHARQGVSR
jgi:uroporphyrinogen-III synthase